MVARDRNDDLVTKNVTLRFPTGSLVLNVNPEEYSVHFPTRVDVVQTLTGLIVDSFGYGVGTGQLAGMFGFGRPLALAPGQANMTGAQQAERLKRLFEEWQDRQTQAQNPTSIPCQIVNAVDGHFFDVVFSSLDWRRSRSSPLVVYYTLPFTVILDHFAPSRPAPNIQLGAPGSLTDGGTPDFPDDPTRGVIR